ncbi:MAG: hypothetical protein MRERC_1c235 [Mycoplasmataceae bacterium RC_NB112A]|nr:MAG: hypothetical protein MRERC_1c235 [Mycoplasmataceae bacterium RC_NB112A]
MRERWKELPSEIERETITLTRGQRAFIKPNGVLFAEWAGELCRLARLSFFKMEP